jgi:hypothetical protein
VPVVEEPVMRQAGGQSNGPEKAALRSWGSMSQEENIHVAKYVGFHHKLIE